MTKTSCPRAGRKPPRWRRRSPRQQPHREHERGRARPQAHARKPGGNRRGVWHKRAKRANGAAGAGKGTLVEAGAGEAAISSAGVGRRDKGAAWAADSGTKRTHTHVWHRRMLWSRPASPSWRYSGSRRRVRSAWDTSRRPWVFRGRALTREPRSAGARLNALEQPRSSSCQQWLGQAPAAGAYRQSARTKAARDGRRSALRAGNGESEPTTIDDQRQPKQHETAREPLREDPNTRCNARRADNALGGSRRWSSHCFTC